MLVEAAPVTVTVILGLPVALFTATVEVHAAADASSASISSVIASMIVPTLEAILNAPVYLWYHPRLPVELEATTSITNPTTPVVAFVVGMLVVLPSIFNRVGVAFVVRMLMMYSEVVSLLTDATEKFPKKDLLTIPDEGCSCPKRPLYKLPSFSTMNN